MPQFIDSIEYTNTKRNKVTLDGTTSVSTVDASTLSVANAREAQHAVTADNATNVTTNINGKAISSIFENDGTTVKNATNATNAINATNATNATKADAIEQTDTRSANELPTFYYKKAEAGQNFVVEFKESAAIGLSGQPEYCQLHTYAKWTDATAGNLTQVAVVDNNFFIRMSTGSTGWGEWQKLVKVGEFGATENATNARNIIPDENGTVNPLGRKDGAEVGTQSTALGYDTTASAESSTALGATAIAAGTRSIALGHSSNASKDSCIALGDSSNASQNFSIALGREATASGGVSTAIGYDSTASDTSSIAIGYDSTASGEYSTALGRMATAAGKSSTALGHCAHAEGVNSVAVGGYMVVTTSYGAHAKGNYSTALGVDTSALASFSTALGYDTTASGEYSIAFGASTAATGARSIALGHYATAWGQESTALGNSAAASGNFSTAIGCEAEVPSTSSRTIQLGDAHLSALVCVQPLTKPSDKRDKTDIEGITDALAFLEKLNPVTFVNNNRVEYISDEDKKGENYRTYGMCEYDRASHAAGTKKGERRRCGLIAQEVVEAMQSVYGTDNYADIVNDNFHDLAQKPSDVENKYTLAYTNLVPFLIGAVKELNAKIKYLEGKLATSSPADMQED